MSADIIESAPPALCRLHLSSELRKLRLQAELTATEVARRLYWANSKMHRLETGANGTVEPSDVIALCDVYGADRELRTTLIGYAAVTKTRKDWWQDPAFQPVIPPGFNAFLGLEATASTEQTYESEFVPGLLQTEAYIRAIHQRALDGERSADRIERIVEVRMTRQAVLSRPDSPLKLTAIINEAVLRRQVGSATVMRDQLAHIAEAASTLPNVKVQVVPFAAGAHPGMNGPFIILRFPGQLLEPIVYLENFASAGVTRRADEVEKYEDVFNDLQAIAPGHQESVSMISAASREF